MEHPDRLFYDNFDLQQKLTLYRDFWNQATVFHNCRSTSAKPADRRSPQERTSQVHREGSRTVKHSNLLKHLLYHSLIISNLRIRSRYVST